MELKNIMEDIEKREKNLETLKEKKKNLNTEIRTNKKEHKINNNIDNFKKREQEIKYEEYKQYLKNIKKKNTELNSSFRFPKINNKYEAEYLRLSNLCDFYKYQQPSNTFYKMYDDLRKEYYRNYRHHMYDFYLFNRNNSFYKK